MTEDALVIFTPSGRRGRVATGSSVLDAARALGVDLAATCGGRGVCGKCQCAPGFGDFPKHGITARETALEPLNEVERRYDDRRGLKKGRRLGCQAVIRGDMVIDVPPESQVHKQVIRKEAEARDITLDSALWRVYVEVEKPTLEVAMGDRERLIAALEAQTGARGLTLDPALLPGLQKCLRAGDWQVTAAIHEDGGAPVIAALWPGYREGLFGLAIDIGSTTIAGHLVDLESGEVRASSGL
ncbi:MAG: drug:proton antiporter, partial [Rhodobacterales bacterium]